ncbi:hypothetical protein OE88DRAFT_1486490 [Heliocybe sulcata]|uniref:Uncharacterized protein n=1 Tax=Heliocybe sulcata TaxID=5364 RepID=A0A5C3N4A5_9AGAM|nr:hypothetical protein OE88DRAFT_1486490 [Heliocybe sulcata]
MRRGEREKVAGMVRGAAQVPACFSNSRVCVGHRSDRLILQIPKPQLQPQSPMQSDYRRFNIQWSQLLRRLNGHEQTALRARTSLILTLAMAISNSVHLSLVAGAADSLESKDMSKCIICLLHKQSASLARRQTRRRLGHSEDRARSRPCHVL